MELQGCDQRFELALLTDGVLGAWSRRVHSKTLDREGGIRAWSSSGEVLYDCRVPAPLGGRDFLFDHGRLFVTHEGGLTAYRVPGTLAPHGWVSDFGSPSAGSVPR